MTLWKWSKTAGSNNTSDTSINWREGQAPSTLNNSSRAIMAAVAKYRDDISGSIVTGGTSTAYTVTTSQVLTALTDKFMVAFTPHTACGAGGVTLATDSLTAKPLRPAPSIEFVEGQLKAGVPQVATYFSSTQEWIVHGFSSQVRAIEAFFDGSGAALTTNSKVDIEVPFACTIKAARLFADQTGSVVVDIWRDSFSNYPPTVADTITASAKPTLSSAAKAEDTTLSGWTTGIAAGDTLRFNLDSVSTITRLLCSLKVLVT